MLSLRGLLWALLLVLPAALVSFVFPPRHVPEGLTRAPALYTRMSRAGQVGVLLCIFLSGKDFYAPYDMFAYAAMVCFALNALVWVRYIFRGRAYEDLFMPLLFLPLPMAVLPGVAAIFLGLWTRAALLFAFAVLMLVGRIAVGVCARRDLRK